MVVRAAAVSLWVKGSATMHHYLQNRNCLKAVFFGFNDSFSG